MKQRLVLLVAITPLLLSGAGLYGQTARGDAAGQDAQSGVHTPATPTASAVGLIDAPELSHDLTDRNSPSDASSSGALDFAGKARYFAGHSFAPGALIGPLVWSAPLLARPPAHYPKEWRQGAEALGRLYGDALAFQTAAQTGKFLAETAFHEDPRYSASSSRNPFSRAMHAMAFTAFDRSDSGRTTVALSNFLASASAGFVGTAYLPHGYNDVSHAVNRMGIEFGSLAVTNLAQEFTPEFRHLGRILHLPGCLLPDSASGELGSH